MPRAVSDKVNKSKAIREMIKLNPKTKAKQIVELLAQEGIDVKIGLVYMNKGRLRQKRAEARKEAARQAKAERNSQSHDPVSLILKVKELASDAGGMDNLKALIAALTE